MTIPLNDFNYIARKVRFVTARPNANQLSDEDLRGYINSFLIYDFPLHTRLFYNRQIFSFQLTPNVGVYPITTFKNLYSNFEPPAYVDGYQMQYYQDESSFNQVFARLKYSVQITSGNNLAGPYNGFFSYTPIETGTCVISTIDVAGNSLTATDNGTGTFIGDVLPGSTINYDNGVITNINWTAVIPNGEPIYASANNYTVGRPLAMLYFNNEFKFYPFPNRAYTFSITAYKNPNELAVGGGTSFPELNQWADVIAYGTALKVLADNLDMENYQKVQILFDQSKRLTERRTLKQLSTQRVATIYGDNQNYPWGWSYPYF